MDQRPLWHEAAALAARAHRNQNRKDGSTPYVAHPSRVALICATVFGFTDETILAAALLHDIIEDCDHDFDDVEESCGRAVAEIVACVTKDMRLREEERETAYFDQIAAGPWQARLIKLADGWDNVSDAWSDAARTKAIGKARHALELAHADPELTEACVIMRDFLGRVDAGVTA